MQQLKNLDEIERKILKSEEDYNNGKVRKAEDVFKEWQLKYEEEIIFTLCRILSKDFSLQFM